MTRKEIADKMEWIIEGHVHKPGALCNDRAVKQAVEEIMQLWDMGFVYELDKPTGLVGDFQ